MPVRDWTITLISRSLDEDTVATEPMFFPELLCCGRNPARAIATITRLAGKILLKVPALELHRRVVPSDARVESIDIMLDPHARTLDWEDPIALRFDVVRWRHENEGCLAYVPVLGIEVICRREPEMPALLRDQILAAIKRSKIVGSLFELALSQRTSKTELTPLSFPVQLKTARQREQDDQSDGQSKAKLVIEQVGLVLGEKPLRPAYEVEGIVGDLADALGARGPRSVLLIGSSGCGKTAIVEQLVRQWKSLREGSPVWSTSGARLIAGMSGYGMWQQRTQLLCKEAARENAILHVGNLVELMQVGRVGDGGGIAGFLRQYVGRGEVLLIAECTPEQLPFIERIDPYLLELFHQLRVEEPDVPTGRRILLSIAAGEGRPASIEDDWLSTLDRLHRRYATYSAYPGRPVRFLLNLLKDIPADRALTPADVIDSFARETGLPRFMLDPRVPLNLPAAHHWFAARLIGQLRAIELVVDLLATVKTSLTRPHRPIASLLFIGPTGVGKTEMAKALAEYFFSDRARLTRFDMSEFARPAAVERLIGSSHGDEGLLTAKVREQPFSVILFDEFEKVHPAFLDLLLQMLGEGRLSDAAGRLADFSNTIVIMTSNLGTATFGRGNFGLNRTAGPSRPTGQTNNAGQPDAERHFTDEVRDFVRPELFNRIDRIVPFMPLERDDIEQIARREIELVSRRDGVKLRGLSLRLSPEALTHLAGSGYDIRYGARPLKRCIERELLAPLADAVNAYSPDLPLEADATAENGAMQVTVRAKTQSSATAAPAITGTMADECAEVRRDVQKCRRCPAVLTIVNQLFRLEQEETRQETRRKSKDKPIFNEARAQRMKLLRNITDELEYLSQSIDLIEDSCLSAFYQSDAAGLSGQREEINRLRVRFEALLLSLLAMQSSRPHNVVVGILGDRARVHELAAGYCAIAQTHSYSVDACWYESRGKEQYRRSPIKDIDRYLAAPESSAIGIGLSIAGTHARLRFAAERGVHIFRGATKSVCCLVESEAESLSKYIPAPKASWPSDVSANRSRRTYSSDAGIVKDEVLQVELRFSGRDFTAVLADALEKQLRQAAWAVMDQ